MNKKLFLLAFLLMGFALLAYPCRCKETTVIDAVKTYDVVLKGKVLSVDRVSSESEYAKVGLQVDTTKLTEIQKKLKMYGALTVAVIQIEQMYKGEKESDIIMIFTPTSAASCGYQGFEPGYNYIVYGVVGHDPFGMGASRFSTMTSIPTILSSEKPSFWTNSCSHTQVWSKDEEELIQEALREIADR